MFKSEENRHSRNRTNFSVTAVFAILLGIIFLLNNFGILPWELWLNLWKFWPVLLILFGIEIILGRNSSPKSFGFLLFLIFILPIILILNPLSGNPLATKKLTIDKPLASITKAELVFALPSASIKINSLEAESSKVISGEINYSSLLPKPEIRQESKFGETRFSFNQPSKEVPFLNNIGNKLNLKISRFIPYDITVRANTGDLNFILKDVKVDFLDIETGAGKFNFELSPNYSSNVYVKANATLLSFKIPSQAAVILKSESSLNKVDISMKRFEKLGNIYKSKNFEASTNKIIIEVSGQLANIEIKD